MVKQVMGLLMVLAIAMPASTTIAAAKSSKLARCDGHHRRPANPYGSILPTVDPQTGTSTPAGQTPGNPGVELFPGKAPTPPKPSKPASAGDKAYPQVPPISSAQPQRLYRSC
ncbi:hypothetical protein [Sphingomonas sp.]|uniref:hypothetical protein n=1 Tax=Sphingomonas sp. TaxID=28214 RepID=UPI0025D4F2CB|nr:hypothetical protein [Sphingomonas sp.]